MAVFVTRRGAPPDLHGLPSNYVQLEYIDRDNTLVNNFIPCKNKETNEIGAYDLIERKFFKNAGTGQFVAGPEL